MDLERDGEPCRNDADSRDDRCSDATRQRGAALEREGILQLLERMRDGDRTAAAVFITRYNSRIRRRIRGKLSSAMRRIFDSQDILSTLGRRLDHFVRCGRIEAVSVDQLWALIFRMANNAIVDKARVFRRLQEVESGDGRFAQSLSIRLRQAERQQESGVEIEIGNVLNIFKDGTDKEILFLWLHGSNHRTIAEYVELKPAAVRKRWQKIKSVLHQRLSSEADR